MRPRVFYRSVLNRTTRLTSCLNLTSENNKPFLYGFISVAFLLFGVGLIINYYIMPPPIGICATTLNPPAMSCSTPAKTFTPEFFLGIALTLIGLIFGTLSLLSRNKKSSTQLTSIVDHSGLGARLVPGILKITGITY